MQSSLDRIAEVNPKLNALGEVYGEEALKAADRADQAVLAGEELGPLHGVPMSIKINSDEKGKATTNGVVAFRNNMATEDSPHVANLRKAGAIFVGRNNSPAFSYRWFTDNDIHGKTLNPWDKTKTPGGSSGGAAVAVASGMMPIAGGNDIGGSVRHPAYASALRASVQQQGVFQVGTGRWITISHCLYKYVNAGSTSTDSRGFTFSATSDGSV